MVKKILGIGVVVLLVGALVGGGAYLLLQDSDNGSGGGNAGRGGQSQASTADAGANGGRWNSETQALAAGTGGGRGSSGTDALSAVERGGRGNSVADDGTVVERGGGTRGGNTAVAGSSGTGTPEAAVAPEDWLTVSGIVVEMEEDLVVRTAGGEEVTFSLGPSWYRDSNGVTIAVGDEVQVTGFYEDGELMAGTVENLSSGQALALRDDSGQPLWSGRGRRGQ